MDNASKNAKDMIDRLTMQYNRGRQAAITNELVDIITGTLSFVLSVTHLLTMNVQVPVHCKQVPWLSNTHQVITPVYIDSETNSDFFALKLHVCDQCKMHNKYGRVHKGILMNRFVRELTNPSVSRHIFGSVPTVVAKQIMAIPSGLPACVAILQQTFGFRQVRVCGFYNWLRVLPWCCKR
jgi:hypothetical protein